MTDILVEQPVLIFVLISVSYLVTRYRSFGIWTSVCFSLPGILIIERHFNVIMSFSGLLAVGLSLLVGNIIALKKEGLSFNVGFKKPRIKAVDSLNVSFHEKLIKVLLTCVANVIQSHENAKERVDSSKERNSNSGNKRKNDKKNSEEKFKNTRDKARDVNGERSPWEVLDIPVGSSKMDIKKAYRKKAQQYHPDRMPDSYNGNPTMQKAYNDECSAINKAYNELKGR